MLFKGPGSTSAVGLEGQGHRGMTGIGMLSSADGRLLSLVCLSWPPFQKPGLKVAPASRRLGICFRQQGNKAFPHPNLCLAEMRRS